jgi:L-rhamnose-H+ transport protein
LKCKPPIFRGALGALAAAPSGQVTFAGIAVTLFGILVVASAGRRKERELGNEAAQTTIAEFDLKKGLLVAAFSG